MTQKGIFIGTDPGDRNYGYSVVEITVGDAVSISILEIGMWTATVANLIDREVKPPKSRQKKKQPLLLEGSFIEQLQGFSDEWDNVFNEYNVVKITSERFQNRGRFNGKSIECVSVMNGALCQKAETVGVDYELITAASWKNQVNRSITLADLYKFKLPSHSVDSCFIAIYGALNYYGRKVTTELDYADIERQLKTYSLK